MNKVTIFGRVGRDPETRQFESGDKVVNFSLAVSERWKDKTTGERKEKTEWMNCAVFGPPAGVIEQYVKKGDQLLVEGKLQTRKWQNQAGEDRYTTEVVVRGFGGSIHLVGGGKQREPGSDDGDYEKPQSRPQPSQQKNFDRPLDDEIPFSWLVALPIGLALLSFGGLA